MEEPTVIAALAALAQPSRLRIYRHLVVQGQAGATPGQLGEVFGLANATLSFHLKELMRAELIAVQRHGRHLIYRAQFDQMNALLAYLTQNCCEGSRACDALALPMCNPEGEGFSPFSSRTHP